MLETSEVKLDKLHQEIREVMLEGGEVKPDKLHKRN